MNLRTILAAAAVLAPGYAAAEVPLPAMGQAPLSGLYISAGVGLNWLQNEHLINSVGTAAPGSISSHLGMVGVASIGYALPMGLRFELEGDLRNNPISGAHDLGFAAAVLAPGYAAAEVPLPAMGQAPLSGLYIGAGVGLNWLQNEHFINGIGTAAPGSISSHLGMVGVASIGYALPMGLRFELEGDLRNNPISGAHDLGIAASAGGRERKYGPMFNVLYDLSPWIPPGYFSPYAGVGVGYQWARLSGVHVNGSPTDFPSITTGGTKGAIAYQFILGGAMPIPQVRGLALTAEYRFFGVGFA